MEIVHPHAWTLTPKEAVRLQREMRTRTVRRDAFDSIGVIAGADISVRANRARAAVVLLKFPELEPLEQRTTTRPIKFPYVPGLLAFREIPVILDALKKIRRRPDLIMADAQGVAHPRRFGLASHLGVILDIPTIGCAKSRLCGQHDEPGPQRGSWSPLVDKGERIGAAVRTRYATKVVYVSVGHRIGLESAIRIVLDCCPKFRIPEPTRLADKAAGGSRVVTKIRRRS